VTPGLQMCRRQGTKRPPMVAASDIFLGIGVRACRGAVNYAAASIVDRLSQEVAGVGTAY
jgi:hypothetical protein